MRAGSTWLHSSRLFASSMIDFRVRPAPGSLAPAVSRVAGSMGQRNTALSLSAGVSNPKVFLGRWFRRNAILFKYACE